MGVLLPLIQMTHRIRPSANHSFSLHNAEEDYLLTPSFVWNCRSVPSKKEGTGAISGGSILEEVVARVSSSLQVREKWRRALATNLKPNPLVLLVDENASRGRWNVGRVGQKLYFLENDYEDL